MGYVLGYVLVTTQHLERRTREFLRNHPDPRPTSRDTLDDLRRDPCQPKLELHPLPAIRLTCGRSA